MPNQNNEPKKKKRRDLSEMNGCKWAEDDTYLSNFCDDVPADDYKFRPFRPLSPQYMSRKGLVRYNNAAKHLLPFRREKVEENRLNIDNTGIFSLFTFSWMSKYIYQAYKKGLTLDDIPAGSDLDSCNLNAQRLESIWDNELAKRGRRMALFKIAVWKFVSTRILISCLVFSLSCIMGFLSPAIFMRKLLEYLEDPNASQMNGVVWALALTGSELLRTMFFALYYSLSYRTALRLRAACLGVAYRKIIRPDSARNTSTGEIINLYALEGPRLYYMIIFGPMIIGGPIISICGLLYIYYILGPWALLGMLVYLAYYPTQYFLSRLTGYFTQKTIKEADGRIKLMTEMLNHIKLIKLYGWENWFSSRIYDVRKRELAGIEKMAYCQSVGISLAPTVPVISGMVTFLVHVAAGGNLTAAQVFSVLVFLTKQMKTSIQVIRDGSLSFYEGLVSVKRFKVYPILVILVTQLRTALTNMRYGCWNYVRGQIFCRKFKVDKF